MIDPLIQLDTKIRFLVSVPDWRPEQATPFQGFAFSLCENSQLLRFIRQMPTDVFELTPDYLPYIIARRIAGQSPVNWYGQSPRALQSMPMPIEAAFTVVILDRSEKVADYKNWLATCLGPVTIVAEEGGTISFDKLSYDTLRDRFLEVCGELRKLGNVAGVDEIEAAIKAWTNPPEKKAVYEIRGHGTVAPNLAALRICGYHDLGIERFNHINDGEQPYVDQIALTTNTIFDEREAHPSSVANQLYPRQPDLNLYLPGTYDIQAIYTLKPDLDRSTRRYVQTTFRILERQSSYKFELTTVPQIETMLGATLEELKDGGEPGFNPIIGIRQREIWLGTEAIACLAASEISAVMRLPNRLNRSRGVIRQFAQHYRADKPQMLKRAELFRGVQRAIAQGFPDDLKALIARSQDGIRIISDAHIEWLDVEGIPLGLRYDVSRIPVTPGNLFIEALSSHPPLLTTPESFQDVLVVSGLAEGDLIAKQFTIAFEQFSKQWCEKLSVKFVRVTSRQELIDAINAFEGMLMLFDGHGSHKPDEPGVLWLRDEAVNVWELRGEITRPPPIVILSACDTHAADRNHATVANGFLALGCRSVLGSVFPLHASHAALFTARLLYRVSDYIPAAISMFKRSLTWLEVVSGMLRRQLVTDILRHLEARGFVAGEDSHDLHLSLCAMCDFQGGEAFTHVRRALLDYGISETTLDRETHVAVAASSTISYLHLGRPETIVINSEEHLSAWVTQDGEGENP